MVKLPKKSSSVLQVVLNFILNAWHRILLSVNKSYETLTVTNNFRDY